MSLQTESQGNRFHGDTDDGAPVKVSGVAMTTNPTKVADLKRAHFRTDAIGRQVMMPYQVRDLIQTAYVTLTTGTETTLLAGVSGVFFDLISVTAATDSTYGTTTFVPPSVDFRSTRAGGIVASIGPVPGFAATVVGSGGSPTLTFPAPIPQDEAGSSWTADMNDITGTNVNITAIFARNT